MEKAYKRISFNEAGNMLYFKRQEELVDFAREVCFYYYCKHIENLFIFYFYRETGLWIQRKSILNLNMNQ
jgi:hypothetical protein